MPRIIFDFVDGAAGAEYASALNRTRLDTIRLQPRVLVNVEQRNLAKTFLGRRWSLPFGIAPMGMCNLAWPGADRMLAAAAVRHEIPVALSTAASTSLEEMRRLAGEQAWFQLYVGHSHEAAFELARRAGEAGYEHLLLTVDTPQVARRRRELKAGFQVPFRIGPSQALDFALHPHWSLTTLRHGAPEFANFHAPTGKSADAFDRQQGRGGIDWSFLERLRAEWPAHLIVKGVLSADDARRIREAGADAIYVSNHGGRQLDSAPAAIDMLPGIRAAVGAHYPLLFDSGVRCGEGIVKALASGANFVMLGRPFLFALGAAGEAGLARVVQLLADELSLTLAQVGCPDIADVGPHILVDTVDIARDLNTTNCGETG